MVKWKPLLIHCWLLFCSVVCSLYNEFHCPSNIDWILRGRWFCTKYNNQHGDYSCLFNDITKVYDESCRFKAHPLDRGEEYVIKHNPTGVACKDEGRYQPFRLHGFQSGCVNKRSKCSESGQVNYHTGNSTVDTVCRCNFKEGYAFIKTPKAVCSCTPSEEDCSCFLKVCQQDDELTADYKCIHKNDKIYSPSCPEMYPIEDDNSNKDNKQHEQVIHKKYRAADQVRLYCIIELTILIVMVMFTVVFCALDIKGDLPLCCYIRIKSPRNLKVLQEEGKLKISWSKGGNEHSSKTEHIVYFTYSDTWEDKKTYSQTVDTGTLHCYLTSTLLPSKTYRFKVVACVNNIKSEACGEVTFETGLPKKPRDIRTLKKEGNISLLWTPPEVSLFEIDQYKIQYTTATDTWTNPPEYVSAESVKYVVNDAIGHEIYRFKMCACSREIEGEEAVVIYQNIASALVNSKQVVYSFVVWQ